jgi:mRNA interferase MazF
VTFDRFDVVAVQYPFLEGDQAKRRPGLIVSTADLQRQHSLCWVVMITTAKAGIRVDDINITDFGRAGLPEPCVIRPSRLTTLSVSQIARRLGAISPKDRNAVVATVRKWLGG